MSSISIYSSTPRTEFRGVKDESGAVIEMPVASKPIILPLFFGLTAWGEENRARFVNAGGVRVLYGGEVLDSDSKFFTHQSVFMNTAFTAGGSAMFLRLVDPAAKQASIRFTADMVADELPEYERNPDGTYRLSNLGEKIPTGEVFNGYRIQIRKLEVPEGDYRQANVSEGNMISDSTGATSDNYPIMDAMARFRGAHGNNLGLRLIAPTVNSLEPLNESTAKRVGSRIYRMQQVMRTASMSAPAIVKSKDDRTTIDFCWDRDARDTDTNTNYGVDKVIINGFEGKTPETFVGWGNMERVHVYNKHIDVLLNKLLEKELELGAVGLEANQINFLTGVDIHGVPYKGFVVEGPEEGGILLTENSAHYFMGGDDGEVSTAKYHELVSTMNATLNDFHVPLYDIAAYPYSVIIDSGFPLPIAMSFTAFHDLRPDISIWTCTQDVSEPINTPSLDSSIGVALKSRLRASQESGEFGTKALRYFTQANAGYLIGSTYDGLVPYLEDTLRKVVLYMGAGNGEMDSTQPFGRGSLNEISRFRDHNVVSRKITSRNADWSNGLNYAESFDIDRQFVPAYQSMYETQNSVLSSFITMLIINNLTRIGHEVWRNWTGDDKLTDEEFFKAVEDDYIARTTDKYDGRTKIIPRAYKTKLDDDLGFSYHLDVDAGFENMRTVQHLAIIARRRRDMED